MNLQKIERAAIGLWRTIKSQLNKDILPILGIVAFSGCSVHALAYLLFAAAKHDTPWFWSAAVLVELMTAWLVWSIVEVARRVTKSNISKQDRRFYSIILIAFIILAIPSLSVSVTANIIEFDNNVLLGLLFPSLSVACAIGAGLPETVKRYEEKKEQDAAKKERKRREAEEHKRQQEEERKAHTKFSDWTTAKERLDMIVQCVRKMDPERKGMARKRVFDLVFNGHDESDSTKYAAVDSAIENGQLEKVGGRITWAQEEPDDLPF